MSNLHQLVLFGSYTDRVLFDVVVVVVEKSVCFNSYHHKSFYIFLSTKAAGRHANARFNQQPFFD